MRDEPASDRVRTVDLLWAFKRACDNLSTGRMPLVHFRLLLSDPPYRHKMVERALESGDQTLLHIARQINALDAAGRIPADIHGDAAARSPRRETAHEAQPEQAGAASLKDIPHWPSSRVITLALSALMLVGLTSLYGISGRGEVTVPARITEDTTWKADRIHVLSERTFVEDGVQLTIEPGVTIKGRSGSALIVTAGARIMARGSRDAPIVMTSAEPPGKRVPGDWGGLVLLGKAPVNTGRGHVEGIDTDDARGDFGGSDPSHGCGLLEYLRIEFAGFEMARNVELNGLTLGGCGSATLVRHVQVHRGLDDGVEVFGGTVDLSHILVTGAGDDGFDWDLGWQGRAQHVIVQMHRDTGDSAFEGDNLAADPQAEPRSKPSFSNVTLIAEPRSSNRHRAMTLRRGTGGDFRNVLISGFNSEAIDLRGDEVARLTAEGTLRFSAIALHASGPEPGRPFPPEHGAADDDAGFREADYFLGNGHAGIVADSGLPPAARSARRPVFKAMRPVAGIRAAPVPQGEFWNEGATFIGAIAAHRVASDWTEGWTAYPKD